jgi:hypothetical protein
VSRNNEAGQKILECLTLFTEIEQYGFATVTAIDIKQASGGGKQRLPVKPDAKHSRPGIFTFRAV